MHSNPAHGSLPEFLLPNEGHFSRQELVVSGGFEFSYRMRTSPILAGMLHTIPMQIPMLFRLGA